MTEGRGFDGRVAIVTGGGTGIGLAIAQKLAQEGAAVALVSRDKEHLRSGRDALAATGARVHTVPVNIRDPDAVEAMVAAVSAELGSPDVLVNNAAANFVCRAEDLSANGWRAIQETVLWGAWFCSVAAAKRMMTADGGVICNILSTVVLSGAAGRAHSAAAKAGVASLTKSLAVEWADRNIRVVGVAPGPVDTVGSHDYVWSRAGVSAADETHDIPLGRFARPSEIASAVAYLCSPAAGFVTGEVLVVDGGSWLAGATYGPRPMPRGRESQR